MTDTINLADLDPPMQAGIAQMTHGRTGCDAEGCHSLAYGTVILRLYAPISSGFRQASHILTGILCCQAHAEELKSADWFNDEQWAVLTRTFVQRGLMLPDRSLADVVCCIIPARLN